MSNQASNPAANAQRATAGPSGHVKDPSADEAESRSIAYLLLITRAD